MGLRFIVLFSASCCLSLVSRCLFPRFSCSSFMVCGFWWSVFVVFAVVLFSCVVVVFVLLHLRFRVCGVVFVFVCASCLCLLFCVAVVWFSLVCFVAFGYVSCCVWLCECSCLCLWFGIALFCCCGLCCLLVCCCLGGVLLWCDMCVLR